MRVTNFHTRLINTLHQLFIEISFWISLEDILKFLSEPFQTNTKAFMSQFNAIGVVLMNSIFNQWLGHESDLGQRCNDLQNPIVMTFAFKYGQQGFSKRLLESSWSHKKTISWVQRAMACSKFLTYPKFLTFLWMWTLNGALIEKFSRMSIVLSLDASSQMISSFGCRVWHRIDWSCAYKWHSPL